MKKFASSLIIASIVAIFALPAGAAPLGLTVATATAVPALAAAKDKELKISNPMAGTAKAKPATKEVKKTKKSKKDKGELGPDKKKPA